jgi:hypothetical protein
MKSTPQSTSPVLHDIEDGELALRIGPSLDDVVVGTHALAGALAEANRLLARY